MDSPDAAQDRLARLAAIVDKGLRSYVEAGKALAEIRDRKLFLIACPTFDEYCQSRWNMSPQHAGRLIAAAEVAEDVQPTGSIPKTERLARPLASLPREDRATAFQEAIDEAGGEPRPEHVLAAVTRRKPSSSKKPPKPIKLRVPGATIIIEPHRGFSTVEAILQQAIEQLHARKAA